MLSRAPSTYIREMYFTSQPMERPENLDVLRTTFEMIDADWMARHRPRAPSPPPPVAGSKAGAKATPAALPRKKRGKEPTAGKSESKQKTTQGSTQRGKR